MATLSFRNLNKIYPNKVQAVFDFNLEVADKEFIVFVGPSGCGKSTTLRMIAGFEEISTGEIYIDDKRINNLSPKDRDIAMVFQNYALYPHLSVFDNIAFALKLRKIRMPVIELDDENPDYIRERDEIIAAADKKLEEGLAELKASKAIKDRYKELRFLVKNELRADITRLEEKYSKQIYSYDHDKVAELDKVIAELKKDAVNNADAIAEKENELKEVMAKEDVPLYEMRHYNSKEISDKVMETATILGLIPYLHRKPAALSGGQRQRVALGRAIVRNPKVFLMDEPLSNLDAKLRVQTRAEITKIHKRVGATTIYVTHDQTEAMTMADRIVIMKDGYIQQIGTPDVVYNKPDNMFVAGFIGSPAMNFINGRYGGKSFVIDEEISLPIDADAKKLLKNYEGKELVMGIRPENIKVEGDASAETPSKAFKATVSMSELLGYERIIYANLGKQSLTIKVAAKYDYKPGEDIKLVYELDKVHFFDKESEKAIR